MNNLLTSAFNTFDQASFRIFALKMPELLGIQ